MRMNQRNLAIMLPPTADGGGGPSKYWNALPLSQLAQLIKIMRVVAHLNTMKLNFTLCCLSLAGIMSASTGCKSIATVSYQPTYASSYPNIPKASVAVAGVSDRRNTQQVLYYRNSKSGDIGQFNRPVADVVREAISTELRKAGLDLSDLASSSIILNCEVLGFQATLSEPPFTSASLDMDVLLRFEWKNAKEDSVLAINERSERRSRKLGYGHTVKLPFDSAIVQGYGAELVNDMLPRVIEREILLSPLTAP